MIPIATSLLISLVSSHADAPDADLVLHGGRIVTLDQRCPVAQALATRAGRIVLVGSDADVQGMIGPKTRVIDLQGRLAIPGFVESHAHFVGLGQAKALLDLSTAETWEEIVQRVKAAVQQTPPGQWILGRGWHQEKWKQTPEPNVGGYPVHRALSDASPHHPVRLTHASGHLCVANAEAMRLAQVTRSTRPPDGGEILHDVAGELAGVFREAAQDLIGPREGDALERRQSLLRAIELAGQDCLSEGITSFQDAGSDFDTIDVFRELAESRRLPVRLWVMVLDDPLQMQPRLARYRMVGVGDDYLTVRAVKQFCDGALGAHGAWLLEPYDDLPTSAGLNTTSPAAIERVAELAVRFDYQLCVHAIGDRANRTMLDLFEQVFRRHPSETSRRWRIEHAQHLHPDDIPRFAELGVIASMQAVHCTSDAAFVIARLGRQRAATGAYAWQSLLKSGAIIANGTDAPVEDVDPLSCFYASVTRKPASGNAFFPEQRMTRQQALRSYTLDAAYAAFEDDRKGSLTPGKLADVVVLSEDILTCPEERIRSAQVVYTIIGGQVRYQRER